METRYYLGYRYPRTRRGRVCALPVGLGRPDPPPYQFARPDARPEPWRIVRARRSCRMCDLCRACLLPLLRSLGHGLCTRPLRRTARHPIGDRAGTSGRDPAEPFSSSAVLPLSSKRVASSECPWQHEVERGVWPPLHCSSSAVLPLSSKSVAISKCPFWHEAKRGVSPSRLFSSIAVLDRF